jgi:hypothetical protein
MKKPTYKIIEPNEDLKFATIQKGNITVDFRIHDMEEEQKLLEKYIKTAAAEIQMEEARMENIEHFHPFVLDFDDEQRSTIYLYQESKVKADKLKLKLEEFETQLKESVEEQAVIEEKLFNDAKNKAVEEAVSKITGDE